MLPGRRRLLTGAVLALASAVCFGIADYAGGLLARWASAAAVALAVQVSGAVLMFVAAPLVAAPHVAGRDVAWGALSGVGTATGLYFLYRGLTRGQMSTIVPLSTVGAVVLPVLIGVVLMGEIPSLSSWIGIAIAVPAIALVSGLGSSAGSQGVAGAVDALISSAGFGLQYIALAQAGPGAGLWPVTSGRVASVLTMVALVGMLPSQVRLARGLVLPAVLNGAVAAGGLTLYMLATRQDLMSVAVVLSSLYPTIPVLLGLIVLRERLSGSQVAGLLGAAAVVVLLTTG